MQRKVILETNKDARQRRERRQRRQRREARRIREGFMIINGGGAEDNHPIYRMHPDQLQRRAS
jgi:hypothetical protein